MNEIVNTKPKIRFPEFTDSWEQRKLENVVNSIDTGKSKFDKEGSSGEYPILGSTSVIGYDDEYDYEGDFILTARVGANAGSLYRHAGKVKISDNTVFIQASENIDFLYHLLTQFDIKKLSFGTGQPLVKASELKNLELMMPKDINEQKQIGVYFRTLDNTITLHQRKCDELKIYKKGLLQQMFPQPGESDPRVRFPGFTDPWEQRKLGDEFVRVNERNDGSFGKSHWISVAKMYFQEPEKVQSNNLDTRTYVMRLGDIAFEGHPNSDFQFGRFVANDIGDGIISELFPIYRHKLPYENSYWKYAIQIERVMRPIYAKAITSSGASSNKLNEEHFLRESILVPRLEEQKAIGSFFTGIDNLITLHQRKCEELKNYKKGLLQHMFI